MPQSSSHYISMGDERAIIFHTRCVIFQYPVCNFTHLDHAPLLTLSPNAACRRSRRCQKHNDVAFAGDIPAHRKFMEVNIRKKYMHNDCIIICNCGVSMYINYILNHKYYIMIRCVSYLLIHMQNDCTAYSEW